VHAAPRSSIIHGSRSHISRQPTTAPALLAAPPTAPWAAAVLEGRCSVPHLKPPLTMPLCLPRLSLPLRAAWRKGQYACMRAASRARPSGTEQRGAQRSPTALQRRMACRIVPRQKSTEGLEGTRRMLCVNPTPLHIPKQPPGHACCPGPHLSWRRSNAPRVLGMSKASSGALENSVRAARAWPSGIEGLGCAGCLHNFGDYRHKQVWVPGGNQPAAAADGQGQLHSTKSPIR
jgi:hypothetical protein